MTKRWRTTHPEARPRGKLGRRVRVRVVPLGHAGRWCAIRVQGWVVVHGELRKVMVRNCTRGRHNTHGHWQPTFGLRIPLAYSFSSSFDDCE